jgi:hypothetical protein
MSAERTRYCRHFLGQMFGVPDGSSQEVKGRSGWPISDEFRNWVITAA